MRVLSRARDTQQTIRVKGNTNLKRMSNFYKTWKVASSKSQHKIYRYLTGRDLRLVKLTQQNYIKQLRNELINITETVSCVCFMNDRSFMTNHRIETIETISHNMYRDSRAFNRVYLWISVSFFFLFSFIRTYARLMADPKAKFFSIQVRAAKECTQFEMQRVVESFPFQRTRYIPRDHS